MKVYEDVRLPYYLSFPEDRLLRYLTTLEIHQREHQAIFMRCAALANEQKSSLIDYEELLIDVVDWADKNNFASLRHMQNVRRSAGNLLEILTAKKIAVASVREGEVNRFTLTEPEKEYIRTAFADLQDNLALPYPTEDDLPTGTPGEQIHQVDISELTHEKIGQMIGSDKLYRINFTEIGAHLLIASEDITDLLRVAKLKVQRALYPNTRTRLLDDVTRDLNAIMTDRNITYENVMRALSGEEGMAPIFFIQMCNRLLHYIRSDKELRQKNTLYESVRIIEVLKLSEETEQKKKIEEEERNQDIAAIVGMLRQSDRAFNRADMDVLRESRGPGGQPLSLRYTLPEFHGLVESMIARYTVPGSGESQDKLLPEIAKFSKGDEEIFIHRDQIAAVMIAERDRVSEDLINYLTKVWAQNIRSGNITPAMKFDEFFAKDVQKLVEARYPVFMNLISHSQIIYNSMHVSRVSARIIDELFYKQSFALFRPFYQMLKLERRDLYSAAYKSLPFSQRFILLRWILSLYHFFFGASVDEKESARKAGQGPSSGSKKANAADAKANAERSAEIRNTLDQLARTFTGEEDPESLLRKLEGEWNQKLGQIRDIVSDKVNEKISRRARTILTMFEKNRSFGLNAEDVRREIESMAETIASEDQETNNREALRRYALIRGLEILRKSIRKQS